MKTFKKTIAMLLAVVLTSSILMPSLLMAFAWRAAPAETVDMSMDLVGMMNMKIFQDSPYIANVTTVNSGSIDGTMLNAWKFSGTGTSIGKNWPHQEGDGPYTSAQIESYFDGNAVQECMDINKEEVAVYMLYDLGDPESDKVKKNMKLLGLTDVQEYYNLMGQNMQISIAAYAGGGTAHESAITAYYRFSEDWRALANSNSGNYIPRSTLLDYGIAAPNENRYFYETKDSQKMLDGSDSFPGVFDESVAQYIDEKESYSLPVWEDTNEDATWNIINPVPTCNIYSRWGTEYDKDTSYEEIYEIKKRIVEAKYGEDYTPGEWYGFTGDQTRYYDGLDIDDMIVPKNWEWASMPYYSTKSGTTYSETTAYKSHLGYGEYVPAATKTYHNFYMPVNQANDVLGQRFMTVMVRETGTMCGLDGCGHWHSVLVKGVPTTNVVKFDPDIQPDATVIDYGLSAIIDIDKNDWVWTTNATDETKALPAVKKVEISADGKNFVGMNTPINGKYGTLELVKFSNENWDEGSCQVKYTPKLFVDAPDKFYYRVYPMDSVNDSIGYEGFYQPLDGQITVVPASLVYYEDNFSANDNGDINDFGSSLIYNGNWSYVDNGDMVIGNKKVNGVQESKNENYGFDVYYSDDLGYSDGSAHKAVKGDTLTFTFKGTGCDVIMRTAADDGYVKYSATRSSINPDGSMADDAVEATPMYTVTCRQDNDTTLYQLPVVNLRYDKYAYYTVTLCAATSKNIYVDGIRIYNPLGFYQSEDADNKTIEEYYCESEKNTTVKPVYVDVYNSGEENGKVGYSGVLENWNEWYLKNKDLEGNPADFQSYLEIGPNNEVYLSEGQAMMFNVTNTDLMDLMFAVEGKAISKSTSMNVYFFDENNQKVGSTLFQQINTSTAMYYEYLFTSKDMGKTGKIVIENAGGDTLAISNFKFSSILARAGVADYTFLDELGNPVEGVRVVLINSDGDTFIDAVTDERGHIGRDDLPVGKYTANFYTPKGYSSVPTRKFEFSVDSTGDTGVFTLRALDLDIGSAPAIYLSSTAKFNSDDKIEIKNFKTYSPEGSYEVVYKFAGTSGGSGYVSNNTYIGGTLSVVVNTDGSASYKFSGDGRSNNKAFSGVTASSATGFASITNDKITIDYISILKLIVGGNANEFKFTTASSIMPANSSMTIQAFENKGALGEKGNVATMKIGADAEVVSYLKGNAEFKFYDINNNPVENVKVTINGVDYYSDEHGVAVCDGITLGNSTATFKTPAGVSNIAPYNLYFDPLNLECSKTFTGLYPFDLDIGSHPDVYLTPTVDLTTTTATFVNYRPFTAPGSMKVSNELNYYVSANAYIDGTIDVVVNSDGTASYVFTGSGKAGDKNSDFSTKSGSVPSDSVSYSENEMSINYVSLLQTITGKSYFNNLNSLMPNDSKFTIQAYENSALGGECGKAAEIAVGADPESTSDLTGTATYTFTKNGAPVPDVMVTIKGVSYLSNKNGVAVCGEIPLGKSTATFATPAGLSKVADRAIEFTPDVLSDSQTFELVDFDLDIGTHPSLYLTPNAKVENNKVVLRDFRTYTAAESYKISYEFDGTSEGSGYVNNNSYIDGTLDITIKPDGTGTYSFDGSGKTNNKGFASKSGTLPANCITYSDNEIIIDYSELLKTVSGKSDDNFRFTDTARIMPNDSDITVQAFAQSESGDAKSIAIGAAPALTTDQKASVSYRFTDELGNRVEGVTVKIGNVILTSGTNGVASSSEIPLGNHTVTFSTPAGLSTPANKSVNFDLSTLSDTADYTLNYVELTIGSASQAANPTATFTGTNNSATVSINGFKATDASSYSVSFDVDYTKDPNKYIDGTITLLISGSKVYCDFNGTGKANKNSFASEGTPIQVDVTSAVTVADDSISFNPNALFNAISSSNQFTKYDNLNNVVSQVNVQAYEHENAGGSAGDAYVITVGAAQTEQSDFVEFVENIVENIVVAIERIISFFRLLFA